MASTDNPNVAERTPTPPISMADVARQLLAEAEDTDGRSALALLPGDDARTSQTVVAILEGRELGPDRWNAGASLLVLQGAGRLGEKELVTGSWTRVEQAPKLVATEDLVVLLTVDPVT